MKTKFLNVTLLAVCLLVSSSAAFAHAVLIASTPKAHETVHGPSLDFDLKFNSRVDGTRSTLSVVMPDGAVKPLSLAKQAQSNELTAHAQLPVGSYTLRWQALAVDGHITRGQIPFTVA
ncbi:MAG: copper resistance protein CopC [Acidobacteriaceae bacterium]|nr:copper resistance protein CopC [Acidobacteriaceae bacterium]